MRSFCMRIRFSQNTKQLFDSSPRPSPRSARRGGIILWGRLPRVVAVLQPWTNICSPVGAFQFVWFLSNVLVRGDHRRAGQVARPTVGIYWSGGAAAPPWLTGRSALPFEYPCESVVKTTSTRTGFQHRRRNRRGASRRGAIDL